MYSLLTGIFPCLVAHQTILLNGWCATNHGDRQVKSDTPKYNTIKKARIAPGLFLFG